MERRKLHAKELEIIHLAKLLLVWHSCTRIILYNFLSRIVRDVVLFVRVYFIVLRRPRYYYSIQARVVILFRFERLWTLISPAS